MKSIYVGNLPFSCSEEEVRNLFAPYGEVISVKFINDRETGRFRGFGFVEMEDDGVAEALEALKDAQMGGRPLRINEALPKPDRDRRPPRKY